MQGLVTSAKVEAAATSLSVSPSSTSTKHDASVDPSLTSIRAPVSPAASITTLSSESDETDELPRLKLPQKRSQPEGSLQTVINLLSSFTKQSPSSTIQKETSTAGSYRTITVISKNGTEILPSTRFCSTVTLEQVLLHIKEAINLPADVGWKFTLDDIELTMQLSLAEVVPFATAACLKILRKEKKEICMDDL